MRIKTLPFAAAALSVFALAACDDDPTGLDGNEQELITAVEVTLTPAGGGAAVTSQIVDPDGPGPNPPQAQDVALTLTPGVTYSGSVRFLDASDPADVEDITLEVEEEDLEHRVFYFVTGSTGVEVPVATLDTDSNGAPLGLSFQVVVDGAATGPGELRVVLSHYDDTPKGDGLTQSNETDADVSFDFSVS